MSDACNPWVVQPPKPAYVPIPVGFYLGTFRGVEEAKVTPTKAGDSGDRWRFSWEVQSGEHKGQQATALTDRAIDPAKLPGILIAGLLGRPIQPGEDVRAAVEVCKGKPYMVSVAGGPKGGKPQVRTCGAPPSM